MRAAVSLIATLGLASPALAQQSANAASLLKQSYTIVWLESGTNAGFLLQKGSSTYACMMNGVPASAAGLALLIASASCASVTESRLRFPETTRARTASVPDAPTVLSSATASAPSR